MRDEYEELPAFEKNEFIAGDLVRVYCQARTFDGTVRWITDDGYVDVKYKDEDVQDNYFHDEYPFQACRKLVKKEPPRLKEIWLDPNTNKVYESWYRLNGERIKFQNRCYKCGEDFNK
jgi:hypothetical protein